jgi:hypothetical protein
MFGNKSVLAEDAARVAEDAVAVAVGDTSIPDEMTLQKIRDAVKNALSECYLFEATSNVKAMEYLDTKIDAALVAKEDVTRAHGKLEFLKTSRASPESIAEAHILADELQSVANMRMAVALMLQFRVYKWSFRPTSFDW